MKPKSPALAAINEAMDLGGAPDFMHPAVRRKMEQHKHPAMPDTHGSVLASKSYVASYNKLAQYLGFRPQHQGDFRRASEMMMQALRRTNAIERSHKGDLEKAAVDLVLDLPEFEAAKQAVESGHMRIDAVLGPPDLSNASLDAAPSEQAEEEVDEIAHELDAERDRRRFMNMLIQGNATNKLEAFHLAKEKLDEIDPELIRLYGVLTAAGRFQYWMIPDEMARMAMEGGEGAGGSARIRVEGEVTVIEARAINFPILVHEIVKGLMEYIAYPEDEDDDNRRAILGKTDTLTNEVDDIRLGPSLYQQLADELGTKDAKLMPYVYDKLARLPTSEFNALMRGVLAGDSKAKAQFAKIVTGVRDEVSAPDEDADEPWVDSEADPSAEDEGFDEDDRR